jgi:nitrite reductase/ring-hydroxylating ferredoxin subunit
VRVASTKDVRENHGTLVTIDGQDIAIFKRDGRFYAVSNVCAHQHFSMLHEGELDGCTVSCPMHGWTYDLRTGLASTGQGAISSYNVRVEGDDVFVEIVA